MFRVPRLMVRSWRRYSSSGGKISASLIDIAPEVRDALRHAPQLVVALESTIITHGMPYPHNLDTALEVEQIVRQQGAVPATVAIVGGRIKVGVGADQLRSLARTDSGAPATVKTSRRDMAYVLAMGRDGGTTVAGTLLVAQAVGIRIFATGGIGGVHREGERTMDVSADLIELGRCPVAVVSSGIKSILDIPRTLEYLETQGVCVATYGCENREFPAFYTRSSGSRAPYNLTDATAAAKVLHINWALGRGSSGILIGVPIPERYALDAVEMDGAISDALGEADRKQIHGKDVTPFILAAVSKLTRGKSLDANMALIKNNARVAAEIAVELNRIENGPAERSSGKDAETKPPANAASAPLIIGGSVIDVCITVQEDDLKVLRKIVHRSRRDVVQYIPERDAILQCSLVLVQNYVAHLRLRPSSLTFLRRERFADAKVLFQGAIDLLIPELQDEVVATILAFLQTENLWKVEFICVEILLFVLECRSPSALLLSRLVDQIERSLAASDVGQVRHVLSVLQSITIPGPPWALLEYSELSKLLRFYHSSVTIGTSRNQIYELRRGFERCLKNLIALLSMADLCALCTTALPLAFDTEMAEEARIEFGSIVEYAASRMFLSDRLTHPAGSFVLEYLLRRVGSEDATRCMLACKILTQLLDRGQNDPGQFQSPKVFHFDTYYSITLATDFTLLRQLLVQYRLQLEQALLQALDHHGHRQTHLEVFYQLLCTLLVEAPGGFTTATIVCLLLQAQKRFCGTSSLPTAASNRVHATIMALMTLIDWIERAGSLDAYITRILKARYDHAPQLNPPLREHYQYAPHHILWHDGRLFFDTLEVRFGLWKCFRIEEQKLPRPLRQIRRTSSSDAERYIGRLSGTVNLSAGM